MTNDTGYFNVLYFQWSFGSRKVRLKRICIYNCKFRWFLDRHIRCVHDYGHDVESVNIFVVKSILELKEVNKYQLITYEKTDYLFNVALKLKKYDYSDRYLYKTMKNIKWIYV